MNSSPRIYKCFGVSHAEAACLQGSRPDFDLLKSWTFWILVDLLAHLWWNPSFYRISQNFERSQLLTPGKFDIFGSSKSAPTKNLKILIFQELGPSIHRFFFSFFRGFPCQTTLLSLLRGPSVCFGSGSIGFAVGTRFDLGRLGGRGLLVLEST